MDDHVGNLLQSVSSQLDAIRKYRKLYDRESAFNFNPIRQFWGVYENPTSAILAFFLNPKEAHGQGDVFLKRFLAMLKDECVVQGLDGLGDQCSVTCEQWTSGNEGRMDIVLKFQSPKRYCICIENKIHAKDQLKQIDTYAADLRTRYGQAFIIVYLTEDARLPSKESLTKRDEEPRLSWLCCVGWLVHMVRLIDRWIGECQAERVRCFLMDFKLAIRREFGEGLDMDELNTVVEKIVATPQSVEAASAIISAWQIAFGRIIENFATQMEQLAGENGYLFYKRGNSLDREADFNFKKNSWEHFIISFVSDDDNCRNMGVGIYLMGSSPEEPCLHFSKAEDLIISAGKGIIESLKNEYQKEYLRDKHWGEYYIAYIHLRDDFNNWDSAEVLNEICNGKTSKLNSYMWEVITLLSVYIDEAEKFIRQKRIESECVTKC